jgi:hypothetical protein
MPARYAYSLNGENYTGAFATRDEALAAALDAARDPLNTSPPQSVFVARRVEADPHAAGHARTVLREMAWQAHDEVGAPAANYLNQLSDEQINELDGLIEHALYDWLRKHDLLPTYFKVAGISEHPVPMPSSENGKAVGAREVNQVGETMDGSQ